MKRALVISLLALPMAAAAQAGPSIALGAGFMTFGTRLKRGQNSFEYSNSAMFDLRLEKGLTRRMGLMIAGIAVPFSGQRATLSGEGGGGDVGVFDDITALGGEVALTFRFKPSAPIYMYGGAAFMHFSNYADPRELGGSVNEPGATLGIGYDVNANGMYNARVQIGLHLMKPADGKTWQGSQAPIPSPNTATSLTQDWSFGLAVRRSKKE